MEIEIKKYVLEQLNGQCIRRKRIDSNVPGGRKSKRSY